jgi:hypothetical protein
MIKHIAALALALFSASALAADVEVSRKGTGSGTPAPTLTNAGVENAIPVNSSPDVLHVPQYLPGYPTAATIWPRIVEVPCTMTAGVKTCEGFRWTPALGRGEYLFITPVVKTAPEPIIVPVEKVIERVVEKKVLVEVPAKRISE